MPTSSFDSLAKLLLLGGRRNLSLVMKKQIKDDTTSRMTPPGQLLHLRRSSQQTQSQEFQQVTLPFWQ